MTDRQQDHLDLLRLLVNVADDVATSRATFVSRDFVASARDRVDAARRQLLGEDDLRLIDYEAAMAVECIAEISHARHDRDARRESRGLTYLNALRTFMRNDLSAAERRLAS